MPRVFKGRGKKKNASTSTKHENSPKYQSQNLDHDFKKQNWMSISERDYSKNETIKRRKKERFRPPTISPTRSCSLTTEYPSRSSSRSPTKKSPRSKSPIRETFYDKSRCKSPIREPFYDKYRIVGSPYDGSPVVGSPVVKFPAITSTKKSSAISHPTKVTTKEKKNKLSEETKKIMIDDQFVVERVLNHKRVNGKLSYLIRWKGYTENEDSWEPESNIYSKELIEDYFQHNKRSITDQKYNCVNGHSENPVNITKYKGTKLKSEGRERYKKENYAIRRRRRNQEKNITESKGEKQLNKRETQKIIQKNDKQRSKNNKCINMDDKFLKWLEKNDFHRYYYKLKTQGVESVRDLTFLERDEIISLARKIKMDLKTRRVFFDSIQCIPVSKPFTPLKNLIQRSKDKVINVDVGNDFLKELQHKLKKHHKEIKLGIQMFFQNAKTVLNDREIELLNKLDAMIQAKSEVLSQQQNSLNEQGHEIRNILFQAETVLDARLIDEAEVMKSRLNDLPTVLTRADFGTFNDIIFDIDQSLIKSISSTGELYDTPISAKHTSACGAGLIQARPGELSTFIIIPKNKYGKTMTNCNDLFVIKAEGGEIKETIKNMKDGTFRVDYRLYPEENESFVQLSILLYKKHIHGSPFQLSIITKIPDTLEYQSIFVRTWGSEGIDKGDFNVPCGLAVYDNIVYVADLMNHRIQVFNEDGTFIQKWGSKGEKIRELNGPLGVATNGKKVFVSEYFNNRIQVFLPDGTFVTMWGEEGKMKSQFKFPHGLALNGDTLYVVDQNNFRIQVFNQNGTFLRMWGAHGKKKGTFKQPYGIAVDNNFVFITDSGNHRVQVFNQHGDFIRSWGGRGKGSGKFNHPTGIAINSNLVYVTDFNNHRIQVFQYDGTFVRMWGMHGITNGKFRKPNNIFVNNNHIYIAEFGRHRIQVFQNFPKYKTENISDI